MAGILFIISAPSGSGKSTLVNETRRLVGGLEFSVSYTTREKRGSEQDGVEYHFITKTKFREMIAANEFLEHAVVFGDNYYGTAMAALEEARQRGHDLLLDIDVQGAMQVMQRVPEAVSLFIVPPNPQTLNLRLRHRSQAEGVTDEALIERRLGQAREELRMIGSYKYALVNDVLEHAVEEMRSVVLCEREEQCTEDMQHLAQACRTSHRSDRLEAALSSFGVSIGS